VLVSIWSIDSLLRSCKSMPVQRPHDMECADSGIAMVRSYGQDLPVLMLISWTAMTFRYPKCYAIIHLMKFRTDRTSQNFWIAPERKAFMSRRVTSPVWYVRNQGAAFQQKPKDP